MQDMLAEDHTNIIDLLINQMFPINLVGILIERIESFSSSMHCIQKFLMSSLKDLNSIFIDSEMSDKKDNNQHRENLMEIDDFMELFPNNYKTIYRTVFLYRILAKLSERYLLQDLLLVAKDFILEVVKDSEHFKYKSLLIKSENREDHKLENLQKEFNESSKILLNVFSDLHEFSDKLLI